MNTRIKVAGIEGFLFYAVGSLPYFSFVPAQYIDRDGNLKTQKFLADRWPYANLYANPAAAGSHIWPDMRRPAPNAGCEVFLDRLAKRIQGVS